MKRYFSCLLALSALLLMAGCKKSLDSSVDLSQKAKAGFAPDLLWQLPGPYTRLIRYDIGDGYGSDCIFAFDLGNGKVSLNEINGTNSTQIYAGTGIPTTNAGTISVTTDNTDITDNFNEIGGVHIIPFDYSGTGHEDHLLVYIPGHGIFYVLAYAGNGKWTQLFGGTAGIGGYDLMATHDKIIAYDYGSSGYRKDLICYRPGKGIFYALQNTENAGDPFIPVVESSNGVGGYDLEGPSDQLVEEEGGLVAYRPGYGYVYSMTHAANSTSWQTGNITRSGWQNFPLSHEQDRMIPFAVVYGYYGSSYNQDAPGIWYSPGNHFSSSDWVYYWVYDPAGGYVVGNFQVELLNWPFDYNPYSTGNTTNTGDHVLRFSAGYQTSNTTIPNAMLMYTNGAVQSQLYEGIGGETSYPEVY